MSEPTTSADDPVVGPDAYAELPATEPAVEPAAGAVDRAGRDRQPSSDDADEPSPPVVLAAMGFGFVPVPFLAMYAVLFISRGFVVPVTPPDVTGSTTGEGWVGVGALVLIVVLSLAIAWYVSTRRRWPFVILEVAVLAAAVYCVYDRDTGPVWIPLVVAVCSILALVCAFLPESRRRFPPPPRLRRRPSASPTASAAATAPAAETAPVPPGPGEET